MKFTCQTGELARAKAEVIILPLFEATPLGGPAQAINQCTSGLIQRVRDQGDFKGELHRTALIYTQDSISAQRILLVGLGDRKKFKLDILREAGGKGARFARDLGLKTILIPGDPAEAEGYESQELLEAFLTGAALGLYQFKELITAEKDKTKKIETCVIQVTSPAQGKLARAVMDRTAAIISAVGLARDLVSLPANLKTPTMLANRARTLARQNKLRCTILTEAQMRKLGMGAFLAVAQGSKEPAKMIVLEYQGGDKSQSPFVVIGKGITFDSGGISIKPAESMERMKDDMAGGAAVIGAIQAVAQLKLPVNLVAIIPATENLPGGRAYKPGDVLTSLSGQTIEVITTDAEGRLILADAITYALRYKPCAIIDLATLTGACITALGDYVAGIMGSNDALLAKVHLASEKTGEKTWSFPLWEEYFDYLKSDIADFRNVGTRAAGTIIGGMFLGKFVQNTPWVHLDIAGPAWYEKDKPYIPRGASGFGVRLLIQLFQDWVE